MWVILGFLVAAAIGLAALSVACRGRSIPPLGRKPWKVEETAKGHVGIMAGLAGFAFTGVVLVVTFARERPGVAESYLDNVVVMFLVSYLWWIGNAFLISFLPHRDASGDLVPRIHFSLASTIEYRTVFLSWFALLPLLEANGLGRIAPILYFLLPASLLFGSVLVAMAADGLGLLRAWESYLSAAVATLLSLGSRRDAPRFGVCRHRRGSVPFGSIATFPASTHACHFLHQRPGFFARSARASCVEICGPQTFLQETR